jgi:hypothetical protein
VSAVCPRLFEVEAMRDGRLTGPELASFGRHMTTCRTCAHEAKALDGLAEALRAEGRVDAPDELRVARERTRLLADFDRALVGSGRTAPRRWLLWSATAVVVACGLFLSSRSRPVTPIAGESGVAINPDIDTIWSKQVDDNAEKVVLTRGALAIHVDHAVSRRGRLVVVLPDGELEDIGTTFTVRVTDGHTEQVAVQEGSVLLRVKGSAPVALSAGQTWTSGETRTANAGATTRPEPIAPPADTPKTKRGPRRADEDRPLPRQAPAPLEFDEPAQSRELRAAVRLLERGDDCEAAAGFATYVASYPDDRRAEDAAYLRVIALQRCGSADDVKRAAREYLGRYPSAFRRAEVERLSR